MPTLRKTLLASALLGISLIYPVMASADAGDILIRLRAIDVAPDEGGTVVPLGGTVEINNSIVPEIDFSYFVTNNFAFELIAATTKHDVKATASGGIDLGSVWLLPPTLLAQYHITTQSGFKPYVGAGINYTIFYKVDEPAGLSIDYENSIGWALQAGFDYPIGEKTVFNVDIKKLFLSTDVSINSGAITADVDIDPWIFGIGFGRYF